MPLLSNNRVNERECFRQDYAFCCQISFLFFLSVFFFFFSRVFGVTLFSDNGKTSSFESSIVRSKKKAQNNYSTVQIEAEAKKEGRNFNFERYRERYAIRVTFRFFIFFFLFFFFFLVQRSRTRISFFVSLAFLMDFSFIPFFLSFL